MHQSLNNSDTKHPNKFEQESVINRIETLRAVVMVMLREIDLLQSSMLSSEIEMQKADYCLPKKLEQLEIDTIRCALIKTNGRQKVAAKLLGMKHTTLHTKIKKHNIEWRFQNNEDQ